MLKSDCPAAVKRLFPVFFETATKKVKWCYHETIFGSRRQSLLVRLLHLYP